MLKLFCQRGVLGVALLSYSLGHAGQSAPDRLRYDVASVKLRTDCGDRVIPANVTPGGVRFDCVQAATLIGLAYTPAAEKAFKRRPRVLGAPPWVNRDRYDIVAKVEGRRSVPELMGPMLLALLVDRFSLKAHEESRDLPIYALTVSKAGPKLKSVPEGSCVPLDTENDFKFAPRLPDGSLFCGLGTIAGDGDVVKTDWPAVTMSELAGRLLFAYTDQPVVDKTGLKGRFNVHLEWEDPALELARKMRGVEAAEASAGSTRPSLLEALQEQLGLSLVNDTGPQEVVIIDHIERPSRN